MRYRSPACYEYKKNLSAPVCVSCVSPVSVLYLEKRSVSRRALVVTGRYAPMPSFHRTPCYPRGYWYRDTQEPVVTEKRNQKQQ